MANQEELLEAIGGMTVLELSEFVDAFKEKFNVTAMAAPVAVAGGAAGGGEADRRDREYPKPKENRTTCLKICLPQIKQACSRFFCVFRNVILIGMAGTSMPMESRELVLKKCIQNADAMQAVSEAPR